MKSRKRNKDVADFLCNELLEKDSQSLLVSSLYDTNAFSVDVG